jgi:hypothetical protein
VTTHTIITDNDGTFLCDGETGELLPLVPNGYEVLKKIYDRTLEVEGSGLRESDLREIIREIRNMAHEGLK